MTTAAIRFSDFLDTLKEGPTQPTLSPERLAKALDLPVQKLADLAHVHRNTVNLAPNSPKLQEGLVDIVRVLSAAYELTGDMNRAVFWFRNYPIPELDHLTAMQLVSDSKAQLVIDHIETVSVGATG